MQNTPERVRWEVRSHVGGDFYEHYHMESRFKVQVGEGEEVPARLEADFYWWPLVGRAACLMRSFGPHAVPMETHLADVFIAITTYDGYEGPVAEAIGAFTHPASGWTQATSKPHLRDLLVWLEQERPPDDVPAQAEKVEEAAPDPFRVWQPLRGRTVSHGAVTVKLFSERGGAIATATLTPDRAHATTVVHVFTPALPLSWEENHLKRNAIYNEHLSIARECVGPQGILTGPEEVSSRWEPGQGRPGTPPGQDVLAGHATTWIYGSPANEE